MKSIRRIFPALVATLVAATVPAVAQTAAPAATDSGPSLLWVWVWILVAGVIVMIVGTSVGANSNKR